MDVLATQQDLVLIVVDDQVAYRIGALTGDLTVLGGGAGVADGRADPGQQLIGAKGFGQVVVRSQVQSLHLVSFMGAGGDHHHWQAGPGPEFPQDLQTIHIGKTQIQNHNIRTIGGDHGQRLLTGVGLHRIIAVVGKGRGDEVGNALFILHHQDLFSDFHCMTSLSGLVRGRRKANSVPP